MPTQPTLYSQVVHAPNPEMVAIARAKFPHECAVEGGMYRSTIEEVSCDRVARLYLRLDTGHYTCVTLSVVQVQLLLPHVCTDADLYALEGRRALVVLIEETSYTTRPHNRAVAIRLEEA